MPPCPGRTEEESLTPALLLSIDSARSPHWPATAVTAEIQIKSSRIPPNSHLPPLPPATTDPMEAAIAPSTVFFGLMVGANQRLPKARPAQAPALSPIQMIAPGHSTALPGMTVV